MAEDWPYRFQIVPIEHLIVDEAYQRPLGGLVKEIADGYDPALVGAVVANRRREGQLALIDGQHRVAGLTGRGIEVVPAVVFEKLSRQQEAQLFADLQTKRRNITTLQRFKAQIAAGDKRAKVIRKVAEETGWEIGKQEHNGLRAIAALESLHDRGPDVLRRTLHIAKQAWPAHDAKDAAHGSLLRGIGRFIVDHDPDDARLITRLTGTTPQEVRFRADAARQGKGSGSATTYVSDVVLSIYMRRG